MRERKRDGKKCGPSKNLLRNPPELLGTPGPLFHHRYPCNFLGFAATGSGISFFSQLNGPIVRISNLRVSAWDGYSDPVKFAEAASNKDTVFLKNRDEVPGLIKKMNEKVKRIFSQQ